jgi:uncharacterized protein (DUF2235 family)
MAKRLVICCDGTWNVPDQKDGRQTDNALPCPSNVAKMALAVAPRDDDGRDQLVFYGKGVGTGRWDRLRGGAFGWGLSEHILDAYRFLMQHFEPDDEIFLFGFSRGAYTARSTAGFIRNSGILKREHRAKLADAFRLYRRRDEASQPAEIEATLFRRAFSHETRIKFVGVWDTVGALGIPRGIPWLPVSLLQLVNKPWAFHGDVPPQSRGRAAQLQDRLVCVLARRRPTNRRRGPHESGGARHGRRPYGAALRSLLPAAETRGVSTR